jgi:hypothetical protein
MCSLFNQCCLGSIHANPIDLGALKSRHYDNVLRHHSMGCTSCSVPVKYFVLVCDQKK